MATRDLIITAFEVLGIAAIFAGIAFEDRLVAFEDKIGRAVKRLLRGE